jgi:hypothetical protein
MNVRIKPFDNKKVRQAVNMAINKERICKIINNRAVPANQPLPPAMPGYDKEYKGYAFDPAKAKALMAEAGLPDGFTTELYANNTDPNPRIAQAIQRDLAEIGITAGAADAGAVDGHRGGRRGRPGTDDLVRRHGLDRGLSGSVQLLWSDPRLRRRGKGRLELGLVLQ